MTPDAAADINDLASLRVKSINDDSIVAIIPGTEYELHLATTGAIDAEIGKRVKGTIHARALRLHQADTGGRFMEPVYGTPRIVQGAVIAHDSAGNQLLLDMAAPVWVSVQEGQQASDFPVGAMVNCYLESGTRFEPVDA